jgi:hypothetical protein
MFGWWHRVRDGTLAERAVRHGVLYRKTSYGTHSEEGSRIIERILSVHATLRQQRRNVLHFIHDACRAVLDATPAHRSSPSSATASPHHDRLNSLRRAVNGYRARFRCRPMHSSRL